MDINNLTPDDVKTFMRSAHISLADLAHELGICEMSARNKVNGKTPFTKLEREKILSLMHKEAN